MARYALQRLVTMVPVLFLVSVLVFSLIHLTPGDPVDVMLGEQAAPEAKALLRQELGLDQPLVVQYGRWLLRAVQGDFGRSIRTSQPVAESIVQRLPVTIELTLLSVVVSLLIALPVGIISATRRNSSVDVGASTAAMLGVSMPSFWLAILLIYFVSLKLRLLPPSGFVPIAEDPVLNLKLLIMPAITLGAIMSAVVTRMTRSSLLEVLSQEYVLTARAKGLRERAVIRVHALKNALIPVVTIVGLQTGHMLGGAIITETIFALPGMGRLVVDSIYGRDFPTVQAVVLMLAVGFLCINLLVDLLYAYLDPRIRYGTR